ncbi:acyl-CoA carboxylase epsilon subunit [Streptomyces xiamenensis]|uniref:acyl-CoA carboxylase epsilon subunit n=2 Tax=Streptomyces TaxID=1883 RepID=UPI0021D24384|nr:acyl-CoA carboxylase epsilon subunit [Streptomyces sp. G-5]MCU4747058.1 acyl-CoA carboxylase subunit epsilon [Streptomyces sp. G-5]
MMIRVVRGNPTPEELAAAVAVVRARVAAAAGTKDAAAPAPGGWAARGGAVRRPLPPPGPGAWQAVYRGY